VALPRRGVQRTRPSVAVIPTGGQRWVHGDPAELPALTDALAAFVERVLR
jgi:hypothetical protein